HPVTVDSPRGETTLSVPTGVLVLYFLLTLVLTGGPRFIARAIYEPPIQGFRARRDARRVLLGGAGDRGRLVPGARPRAPRLRRRGLERVRAVAPARARRAAPADPHRPRRGQPVPHPARARGGAPRPSLAAVRGARRLQGGRADARGVRGAPPDGRLPRGGVQ